MSNIEEKFHPITKNIMRRLKRQVTKTKSDVRRALKPGKSMMDEDAPANAAGGGNIAGIGVGLKGEPGISSKVRPRVLRRKAIGRI